MKEQRWKEHQIDQQNVAVFLKIKQQSKAYLKIQQEPNIEKYQIKQEIDAF